MTDTPNPTTPKLIPEMEGEITNDEIRELITKGDTTPTLADTPPASAECEECHGDVRPGHMCPACGNNRQDVKAAVFLIATQLPYSPPRLDCCEHAAVQVQSDPDGRSPYDVIVHNAHSVECDVWQYI